MAAARRAKKMALQQAQHLQPQPAMASHAAASGDDVDLAAWTPFAASADADLLPDLGTMMARSRDMSRNNGLMAGGMQTLRDNIVGATLRLSATPDHLLLGWSREQAREWGNYTEAKFRSWADTTECDASRSLNLLSLTIQALGGALLNGDAVALPLWIPRAGQRWNTRLMMVESDRLATPLEFRMRDDIRGGVQFDRYGAPLAYYILKQHPGDMLLGSAAAANLHEFERIPAFTAWGRRRVIHVHDKERAGQSRGKPIVSSVMRELHMAGKYATNELRASVANSLVAAFIQTDANVDPNEVAKAFGKSGSLSDAWRGFLQRRGDVGIRQTNGASFVTLPPGANLNTFSPGRPNPSFEAFMLASLRNIAAGMNMPYELLVKDFSKSNYSSARAALLEAWRYFNGRRRWLTDYWLRPVYELWLEEAVNAGEIEAPGFYENRYAYVRARFIFGGRGWVDPVKDATAAQIRMQAGISTLERECAEQGDDYEEVLDQLAFENRRRQELGLPSQFAAESGARRTAPVAAGNGNADTDGDGDTGGDTDNDDDTGSAA